MKKEGFVFLEDGTLYGDIYNGYIGRKLMKLLELGTPAILIDHYGRLTDDKYLWAIKIFNEPAQSTIKKVKKEYLEQLMQL